MIEIDIQDLVRGINARRAKVSVTTPSSAAPSRMIEGAFQKNAFQNNAFQV